MKSRRLRELAMLAWRMSHHCLEAEGQQKDWVMAKYSELILHECFHALHQAGYGEAVEPVKKHFLKNEELVTGGHDENTSRT
jgi:hypothetical protein